MCANKCCWIQTVEYSGPAWSKRHSGGMRRKAGMFIMDGDTQKVVIVQSRGGMWGLPKGSMKEGETALECAMREVKEETGLDVEKDNIGRSLVIRGRATYYEAHKKECPVFLSAVDEENDVNSVGWVKPECLIEMICSGRITVNQHCREAFRHFAGFLI